MFLRLCIFSIVIFLGACATYQGKVEQARLHLENGQYTVAVDSLRTLAEEPGNDQLVYLLDYAIALQVAGNIEESIKALIRADRLADEVDYTSVSRETGAILLNEEMLQYKGDTFEKIFINAELAMNFLSLGKLDEALVEARRMNEKYMRYREDDKKSFELNVLGKYLSALAWEASARYDDAYIAYHDAYKIDPTNPVIQADLVRMAKIARRPDAYTKWKKQLAVQEAPQWYDRNLGEVIVLFKQGWGPRKRMSYADIRFPELSPYRVRTQSSFVKVESLTQGEGLRTEMLYDAETAAIQTLHDDYGRLVARRLGGIVAKEVLADQVRQKNEALGALTAFALHVSDRADLRQWSTLPQTVQIRRMMLPPGKYRIESVGIDYFGNPTGPVHIQEVQVEKQKKSFVIWRALK